MRLTKTRYRKDGLSNLNYKVLSIDRLPTYTRVLVDLLENDSREALKREYGFRRC